MPRCLLFAMLAASPGCEEELPQQTALLAWFRALLW
jgi:hypothetical protein